MCVLPSVCGWANTADPGQTAVLEQSDLGLHCSNSNAQISIFSVDRVVYQLIEIQALTVHVAGFPFIYPLYHEIYIIFSSFNIIEKS